MLSQRSLARLLLVLLLVMQYATLAHSTEHHLLDDSGHCAACALQQHFGQATPVAGIQLRPTTVSDDYERETVTFTPAAVPNAFRARAPPIVSLN